MTNQQATKRTLKRVRLDINDPEQLERLLLMEDTKEYCNTFCDFQNFLKDGKKSPVSFNGYDLYVDLDGPDRNDRDASLLVHGKRVWDFCHSPTDSPTHHKLMMEYYLGIEERQPSALLISPVNEKLKSLGLLHALLLDADGHRDDSGTLVDTYGPRGHPAVSFGCISQMFNDAQKAIGYLVSGRLTLVDFTEEVKIPVSEEDKKKLHKMTASKRADIISRLNRPGPGFSLVGLSWHQSGTCLFKDYRTSKCYLFGQDDGTYFGCELPKEVTSVAEAFDSLLPDVARGKPYIRQGEWFIIPAELQELPTSFDCAINFHNHSLAGLHLPVEDDASNLHRLKAEECRVSRSGVVYARDGELSHRDHPDVAFRGWQKFARNTAVRSVSQEGVD